MNSQMMTVVAAVLVMLVTVSHIQTSDAAVLQNSDGISADKRPKYMDTRELDLFKDFLITSLREMAEDGQINPNVLPSGEDNAQMSSEMQAVAKRMQYMGICMRRRHNTFIPYPCLRSGGR